MKALLLALILGGPALAQQPFEETLSLTLDGEYSVHRLQSGSEFAPITLTATAQQNVPLVWQTAPVFQVVCTNGQGWSVTLRGPAQLSGPAGAALPLDYAYGSGRIQSVDSSDVVAVQDSRCSGSLSSGTKTISVEGQHRGSYRYQIGNFCVPHLPAQLPAGSYGGGGLLVTTFSNTP